MNLCTHASQQEICLIFDPFLFMKFLFCSALKRSPAVMNVFQFVCTLRSVTHALTAGMSRVNFMEGLQKQINVYNGSAFDAWCLSCSDHFLSVTCTSGNSGIMHSNMGLEIQCMNYNIYQKFTMDSTWQYCSVKPWCKANKCSKSLNLFRFHNINRHTLI